MLGQTISHYKIVEKLGEGGMGVVYKAEDLKLERFVALKFLAPHLVEDEEGRRRFQREAKAAAALDHPNVCTIHEIDEAEGRVFLAMAYLDGSTVRQKVKQRPLKLDEALDIAIQAGQGLQVAHEKGIVHRDIKSANLMVNARGQVKIMDFGLAQLAEQSKLTKTATILGTPAYMSPEQARRLPTDRRTDVWSLGVVIYEMVTGRTPFEGEREQAVLYAIASEQPEPITALRVGIPTELDRIVGKALAKKPEERYQHIDEMLVDLRELQRQAELGARDTRRARPASKPVQRRGWYIAAAAVVITLTVAVSAWMGVFGPADEADEAAPEPLRAVQLTSYPGNESSPSFSPNGDQIAFRWDGENQENFDIYVKPIDSPSPLRLTTHPARDSSPAWSPDGRTIAFARELPGGKLAVLLIPAIGGPERKVAEIRRPIQPDVFNPHLAWAPGSEGLVVVDRSSPDEPFGLFLLSTESGQKRRLTSPPAKWMGDSGPAFSPDGRSLAFSRRETYGVAEIYVLSLSEDLSPREEPRQLTFEDQPYRSPAWTPDGRAIVFATYLSPDLWRISISGPGRPQRLPTRATGAAGPAISRRGNRLAYSLVSSDNNIWRLPLPGSGSGPGSPTRFVFSTRTDFQPRYSPDGERVAFVSFRTGTSGIWLSEADGSNAELLFSQEEASFSGSPRWSPDGQRMVFDSDPQGQTDVYVISARGGNPIRLTSHPADDSLASWSRDGEWIYFTSRRGGRDQMWRMPAGGGKPDQVTRNGGRLALESPDGKFLYHTKSDEETTGLWKVPVGGGEETRVLESVHTFNFYVTPQGIY